VASSSSSGSIIKPPVVSVHWSPPFEGPLSVASDCVEDYYVAYSAFERMLDNTLPKAAGETSNRLLPMLSPSLEESLCEYANSYTWEQRLQPGEMLIFNNQRMLHGRRAFTMSSSKQQEGQRHLMGCYTNIDDTLNEYRLLRRQCFYKNKEVSFPRIAGNGSSGTN
jgi:gamma-butyrobetaine dioxygenase